MKAEKKNDERRWERRKNENEVSRKENKLRILTRGGSIIGRGYEKDINNFSVVASCFFRL